MIWVLVDSNNVVKNIIVYDGVAPYAPPEGLVLKQASDSVRIGDILDD